jgi:hypothetical protein
VKAVMKIIGMSCRRRYKWTYAHHALLVISWSHKAFEYGTWRGEIRPEFEPKPGEIVATEHWCSSGFDNTDLDLQLKKHGIHQLIVMGLIAHTCVEATVRYAAELGYEVTMEKTRPRITRMKRCTPLSTSTSQTAPVPL